MKINYVLLFLAFIGQYQISLAQETNEYVWWNPSNSDFFVVEGQAWPDKVEATYDRLPKDSEKKVRGPVWRLSKHSAGLLIRFKSDAQEIKVRYTVKGEHAMPHMPATGVSGVDLYVRNKEGDFLWCKGNYSFNDTIQYHFKNLELKDKQDAKVIDYQLFLPLYNSVEWLEIGVSKDSYFEPLPVRKEKPIVVYGTSIAQGACASRPGMAWTSILSRKMDSPLINLAFSGNGLLENEMIELLNSIDAKIYILDCLPNLVPNKDRTSEELYQRIITSVRMLREKHQKTPILLVDHSGYPNGFTNKSLYEAYMEVNEINEKAFEQLKSEGVENLYRLTKESLNLGMDDFVDGSHPSDLGMMNYALGYEKSIRMILRN